MARHRQADTRYLELHRGKWRATVAVPRPLHTQLGSRLKRPLNTTSLARADQPTDEALTIAAHRARADAEEREGLDAAIADRAEDMRGDPIDVEADDEGRPVYVYDPEREKRAAAFADMAMGRATPISHHHAAYLSHSHTKARTQGDSRRAIAFLTEWCGKVGTPATLEAITRKEALRFHDALPTLRGAPPSPVTLNKYLGRLSVYWQWMRHRELVEVDPWQGIKIKPPQTPHNELERPFTDDEVHRLLAGQTSRARDVDLKAHTFTFKPQKKEKAARAVPINSALVDIVARRMTGKRGADDLFPEYPVPRDSTSQRERSFAASREFTEYRRAVGVDEIIPGKRRSLVNFHSWRRYFVTKAEQAGQPEHLIATVVGHKRPGITLGRYSSGPLLEQLRTVVESVKLPTIP